MKRRRGSKKGRTKKPKLGSTDDGASNAVSPNTDDNDSGPDESDHEEDISGVDADAEAEAEAETEPEVAKPPPETIQPEKPVNTDILSRPISNTFGKAVYTRVKVRIKTSKNLDSQRASSDAPIQIDTGKSGFQLGLEKQEVPGEKREDSANSLSETNGGGSGNTSQKSLGIKIKSKGLGSTCMSPCSNTETVKGDRVEKKDTESLQQESRSNEQELKAALEVIKKVMKMDAAEPFNAPVNPVALGIPDYFDVIKTPMDFGTICNNLEKGVKYKNSEDVFKDVQYIWENCYKYNNKGDYIVELMRRVKKSFTKYWTALGLFNDQPQENNGIVLLVYAIPLRSLGSESNAVKELSPSSEGNTPVDGGALNLSGKKFHGLKKHKEGCQCAICVMMRRRQEREEIARMMGGQTEGSDDDSMGEEDNKPNGISRGGSPFGEYASSNMENSSDAETGRRGQEMKLGHIRNFYGQHLENAGKREGSQDLQVGHDSLHYLASHETCKDNGNAATNQEMPKEALDKNQRAKMLENLRYLDNPMLLDLYGTLFVDSSRSFWNGPHSLSGGTKRRSSLSSAIASLMK
ncbi:bromodomain-containing protein [Striga asiatica]|uniref:Bromodomain-containing protein n=1 Tax=Striga asiatica TaxID=4170 RepID=A0A5A7Q8B1_STRAF|nr:bromodomain-containing protein [Striga asiatica]